MEDQTRNSRLLSKGSLERIMALADRANQLTATAYNVANGMVTRDNARTVLLTDLAAVSAAVTILLKNGDLPHPPTDDLVYAAIDQIRAGLKEPHA